jgi:hypothetical protein
MQRLMLLGLVLSAPQSVKNIMTARFGLPTTAKADAITRHVFEIPTPDLLLEMRAAALAHVLDYGVPAAVRREVAGQFGIDLAKEWQITTEYLDQLTKGEIVRIGEEEGVGIWTDPKAEAYRKEHFKGRALMALKKEELADIVLKSGAELAGRVPAEVLGKKG